MFINLTNHPLASWQPSQIEAAKVYGQLEEMVFPDIAPNLTGEQVKALAASFADSLLARYDANHLTVHLMGEMTFTFHLVEKLKANGIRCVASTSERIVEDLGDGKKVVRFAFVRFREY